MQTADFTIADKLDQARALIERGWCQCRYSIDASGNTVPRNSPEAIAWCATGAIEAVTLAEGGYALWQTVTDALDKSLRAYRTCWNDHPARTQGEVVEAFRKAAAELRGTVVTDTWTKADAYLTDIEDVARERCSA